MPEFLFELIKYIITPIALQIYADITHRREVDLEFRKKSDETFAKWAEAKSGDDDAKRAAAQALHSLLSS